MPANRGAAARVEPPYLEETYREIKVRRTYQDPEDLNDICHSLQNTSGLVPPFLKQIDFAKFSNNHIQVGTVLHTVDTFYVNGGVLHLVKRDRNGKPETTHIKEPVTSIKVLSALNRDAVVQANGLSIDCSSVSVY